MAPKKFYDVTFVIAKIGTKVERLSEQQLQNALAAWKDRRSVVVPSVGVVRGRSITKFSYKLIEEEVKEDG